MGIVMKLVDRVGDHLQTRRGVTVPRILAETTLVSGLSFAVHVGGLIASSDSPSITAAFFLPALAFCSYSDYRSFREESRDVEAILTSEDVFEKYLLKSFIHRTLLLSRFLRALLLCLLPVTILSLALQAYAGLVDMTDVTSLVFITALNASVLAKCIVPKRIVTRQDRQESRVPDGLPVGF